MSDVKETFSEREEIEMLLPWFVTGRLDAADKAKVEAFLAREPAMRRQLDLVREEQGETIAANEAVVLPRGVSVARGMAYVTANSPGLRAKLAGAGVLDQVRGFFSAPTAKGVRYAAIAAAAVIALQAATLGTIWSRDGGQYGLAGGPQVTQGTLALVKFKDGATASAIAEALTQLDMRVVNGPMPGSLFTVRLAATVLNVAEREQKLAALRQRSDVIGTAMASPQR